MILFRKTRERLLLLEYENAILAKKIKNIEDGTPGKLIPPFGRRIREDGWDLSYDTLRKKYRDFDYKFKDNL